MKKRFIAALTVGVLSVSGLSAPAYEVKAAEDVIVSTEETNEGTYTYEQSVSLESEISISDFENEGLEKIKAEALERRENNDGVEKVSKKIAVNNKNFPDENFRKVISGFDYDLDGYVNVSDVDIIQCYKSSIKSFKGIELLTELFSFSSTGNDISELDLSKNTKLQYIYISDCKIDKLDLTKFRDLEYLALHETDIKSINTSKCSKLVSIDLYNSKNINKLDISQNKELRYLVIAGTGISDIDASNNNKIIGFVSNKSNPVMSYKTHIQSYGWEDKWTSQISGTVGEAKRLEGIKLKVYDSFGDSDDAKNNKSLGVEYRTHIQSYGWENDWKKNGEFSGTEGESKRLEAIEIRLTGTHANLYNVYYRVHAQSFGWLGFAKNGAKAGTAGMSKRLEAIEVYVAPKGTNPCSYLNIGVPELETYSYVELSKNTTEDNMSGNVCYMAHVQSYGDQNYVSDGSVAGTVDEAKRLEGYRVKLNHFKTSPVDYIEGNLDPAFFHVYYKSHIQSYGWEDDYKMDGEYSGTVGEGKRIEAVQIKLDEILATNFDIYYRVYVQSYGWLDWACNDEPAGTVGLGKRVEAIQVIVAEKTIDLEDGSCESPKPGPMERAFISAE